jgi:hypothetical protein
MASGFTREVVVGLTIGANPSIEIGLRKWERVFD